MLNKVIKIRIAEQDYSKVKLQSKMSEFKNISSYCRNIILENKIHTLKSVKDDAIAKSKLIRISSLLKKTLGEGITIENRNKLNAAIKDLKELGS